MQLIIPMSGTGERFRKAGYSIPKPLLKISGKTMVQHVIEMYPGISDVLFIVNKNDFENETLSLESHLRIIAPDCQIAIIDQHKFGPAWAINEALEYVNKTTPVIVNYCDFSCIWNFSEFKKQLESGIDGLIATYSGFHPHMIRSSKYAYLQMNSDGFLSDIQEKQSFTPFPEDEPASSGTYGFKNGKILLDAIRMQIALNHSYNSEYYMSLTYKNMIKEGFKIRNFEIEKFLQWGTPEDFEDFKSQKDYFHFRKENVDISDGADNVTILAAGAGQRFLDAGYLVPKPFLNTNKGYLIEEALLAIQGTSNNLSIVLQDSVEIPQDFLGFIQNANIEVKRVCGLTRGQAESALFALREINEGDCIVGTCDSLIHLATNSNLEVLKGNTMGVWVAHPNQLAMKNPEQFGWVDVEESNEPGKITQSWIKKIPEDGKNVKLVTGAFYFADVARSITLIEDFIRSEKMVNGEYYLDSLIDFGKSKGWNIVALEANWFISLGTPSEYKVYRYWEDFFDLNQHFLISD